MSGNKSYTLEEDQLIVETITAGQAEGKPIGMVVEELAEQLGRSTSALEFRYYSVLKPQLERREGQEAFEFVPYTGSEKRGTKVQYSPEDDERIWSAIQLADEEGIPLSAVYGKLAEDLDRTAKAIEVRCNLLKKRHREDNVDDDDDDDDDGGKSILSRLKAIVKERDYYKSKYEGVEDKLKDYEQMARELRKIRRLLE
jgi:hypothetical protein